MTSFASDHSAALAALSEVGRRVSFTRRVPGSYDPSTDTETGATVSTIAGIAMQVRGDPQRYAAQELILSTMPTLLFASDAYPLLNLTSDFVMPGDSCEWNGIAMTVRDVDAVAPDGTCIIARIVVGK